MSGYPDEVIRDAVWLAKLARGSSWQRYREVVGRSGDYYVVERQVVGTPLKATP